MHKESVLVRENFEKCIIIGIHLKERDRDEDVRSMEELRELAETAGFEVMDKILVTRESLDPTFLIGTGKAAEILEKARENKASCIIFDEALNPLQGKNLEKFFEIRLYDRIEIILDIFAKHASSHEAKIQIELAQLKYMIPRLARMWTHLSRQEGSLGVRGGPGEKQIEIDKRRIKEKIHLLTERLKDIDKYRSLQRKERSKKKQPRFTIIGYTNSGKSMLLNRLTSAGTLVKNQLFSTLDSLSRKMMLPSGKEIVLTDTVGFIRNLPHFLIEAFRSTLSEVVEADCLIHLIDGSASDIQQRISAVSKVIYDELKINDKRIIKVINKTDLLSAERKQEFQESFDEFILVSALTGDGVDLLLAKISDTVQQMSVRMQFFIPMDKIRYKEYFYGNSSIIEEEYTEKGLRIVADVSENIPGIMDEFRLR